MAAEFEKLATQLREKGWSAGANFTEKTGRNLYMQGLIPESLSNGQFKISEEESFGGKIRDYRKRRRISQRHLGHKIGLNHSIISRVEGGERKPSMPSVVRIIKGLELSSEQIFDVLNSFEK